MARSLKQRLMDAEGFTPKLKRILKNVEPCGLWELDKSEFCEATQELIREEDEIRYIVHSSVSYVTDRIKKHEDVKVLTRAYFRELNGEKRSSLLKMLESRIKTLLGE